MLWAPRLIGGDTVLDENVEIVEERNLRGESCEISQPNADVEHFRLSVKSTAKSSQGGVAATLSYENLSPAAGRLWS
ncbi:hypothetical protein [Frankia sp. BMG5.23]|uniref:hypothetical protein n=1 Tax=Frankia sp. BMG5.23 TaxID=683305 RepID=UPI00128F0D02|nr:hypothetical protein [Frankia sp. BMG5.23]